MSKDAAENQIAELVKRIRDNDLLSLGELMKLKSPTIFAIAFNILKDKFLAEDVVNETLIRLIENVHDTNIKNFGAWINAVAVNKSLDVLRRSKRESVLDETDVILRAFDKTIASDPNARAVERMQIAGVLQKMTPESAEILTDKFIGGMSIRAIAVKYSLTFKQARKRIEDAKAVFKSLYEED